MEPETSDHSSPTPTAPSSSSPPFAQLSRRSTANSQYSQPSSQTTSTSSSGYFTFPMTYAVSGILRRLSSDPLSKPKDASRNSSVDSSMHGAVFNPPQRKASPFQPPPLTPLTLSGWRSNTKESARLLTRALAEEIRLLVPPRLQLVENWKLIYSLEQNGTSLSTLYAQSNEYRGKRGAFVLVVRDASGGTFGAYLSDALHPSAHYYGTGECFLWKASVLNNVLDLSNMNLPPPPSEDTTNAQRQTTLLSPKTANGLSGTSGTSTPERIRFKAFPYSGVNDYMIFCEQDYLSVGGGDGHYGLWLDDSLDKGVSSTCLTFGNEPLSEEGAKFEVMGVELWYLGA
ncbi:uncharacterized protein PV09_05958 [Verruconis gallopava]|uniref:Oxidation resistance protein 1 n=1 Tax=Verruconis gallopava TaxID=253628 RepID=A0A0D2A8L2_9PEZI|nr:uncharacterized protein PV09_05958 [Verruconis gallopava]KIW02910.1 hypothetical protein PV09_05958 [Verruconis gallopava]